MNEQAVGPEQYEENPATLADLEGNSKIPVGKRSKRRFKQKAVLFSGLLLLGAITFLGAYFLLRGEQVYLKANNRAIAKVSSGADIRQAAFDSLRDSLPTPSPMAPPPPMNGPSGKTDLPDAQRPTPAGTGRMTPSIGASSTLAPPADFMPNRPTPASTPNSIGHDQPSAIAGPKSTLATTKASVRFAAIPQPPALNQAISPEPLQPPQRLAAETARFSAHRTSAPSFGSMLPIRLMGVLYTIRAGSLARFELMRDLKTEQWQLVRGTVFVGSVTGSGADRAFVQIKGFIDPMTHRFVRIDGEVLGEDGGAGLRGKTRRAVSVWGKALDRAARAGMQIATSVFNRGASSVIIAADPYGAIPSLGDRSTLESNSSRPFVEVPAGAAGFVVVTTLPKPDETSSQLANNYDQQFTDGELAELLQSADPDRIRAAIPRMTPELRRIAELTLKEIDPRSR